MISAYVSKRGAVSSILSQSGMFLSVLTESMSFQLELILDFIRYRNGSNLDVVFANITTV